MSNFKPNYFQRRSKPLGPKANEKINYKVREHSLAKVPFIIVCGKKEVAENTVTVRRLGSEKQETIKRDDLIKNMLSANKLPLN